MTCQQPVLIAKNDATGASQAGGLRPKGRLDVLTPTPTPPTGAYVWSLTVPKGLLHSTTSPIFLALPD